MKIKSLTYSTIVTLYYEHQKLNDIAQTLRKVTSGQFRGCILENRRDGQSPDLILAADLQPSEVYSRGGIVISPDVCHLMLVYDYGTDQVTAFKNFNQSCEYVKIISQLLIRPAFLNMNINLTYEFDDFETFASAIEGTFYQSLIKGENDSVGYRFAKVVNADLKLQAEVYNSSNQRIYFKDSDFAKQRLLKFNVEIGLSSTEKYHRSGSFDPEDINRQFVVFDELCRKLQFRDILTGEIG